jgi:hypothetical protein
MNMLLKLFKPVIKKAMFGLFEQHRDKIEMTVAGLHDVKYFLSDILNEIIEEIIQKENLK